MVSLSALSAGRALSPRKIIHFRIFNRHHCDSCEDMGCCLSIQHIIRQYITVQWRFPCGGGIEYLHRSPASSKRRRKGPVPGVYLGHPVPGGYKYRDMALQVAGVSRIGTKKYGLESRGTQTRAGLRWWELAATVNYRPVFSSKRALQNNKPTTG
jgi:hypothetical protein